MKIILCKHQKEEKVTIGVLFIHLHTFTDSAYLVATNIHVISKINRTMPMHHNYSDLINIKIDTYHTYPQFTDNPLITIKIDHFVFTQLLLYNKQYFTIA